MTFSGVTILHGVEFPIFLLIFARALQQCSATALPVIQLSRIFLDDALFKFTYLLTYLLIISAASILITGSAVALHCCKAHTNFNKKMGNSTPGKIVTHEIIILKLCIRD